MPSTKTTNTLLAVIAVLLLWHILAQQTRTVRAAPFHQYKTIFVNDGELQKTLNQNGSLGWAFKQITAGENGSQRLLILEQP